MTLQEFLKLNSNGKYLVIYLYNDIHFIDCYYKYELKDSIYLNKKVVDFHIDKVLEIEIKE